MTQPVALIVLDGWGLAPDGPGNAVARANTPNFDRYWRELPKSQLAASGQAVGLPDGQIGNSEVGHLNLGAGRIVKQSLSYIRDLIADGSFFSNDVLRDSFSGAQGGSLHLMGLVSDGGVHSDLQHLYALLDLAKEMDVGPVYVHAFTDGRDVPPDSGLRFVAELKRRIDGLRHDVRIASVCGRYYAMDRDRRWQRVKRAYDAIVCADAEFTAPSAEIAVERAYARGETDEFIQPTLIANAFPAYGGVADGDAVVFFNFRADRARQLSASLLADSKWGEFERCRVVNISFTSLMEYDRELRAPFAFAQPPVEHCLADVLARAGKTQYHTAETEKYPHVTYFFNATREEPFPGEARKLIPSPRDVPTYDHKPEMSAPELTAATLARIEEHDDDFVLLNFANPDMVGHTGVLDAAVKACETVDESLGKLVQAFTDKGGAVIIVADHGNAEIMIDERGEPHTAHTTSPVPCIVLGAGDIKLRGGVLGNVAPTVLELLGLDKPAAMNLESLLVR